jgi:hypothetical protein
VFRVLLLIGFVAKFWWLIPLVLAAVGVGLALWLGHQRRSKPVLGGGAKTPG